MAAQRARRAPSKPAKPPKAQPVANPVRGEHTLELGGTRYRLRPSRAAIVAIEEQTDLSMLELMQLGNIGGLKQHQLGVIAAELIKAGAEDELTARVGADGIGDLIYGEGTPKVTARLTLCLLDAAKGGRDAEGNAKAAAA